jgi:hypothetical protein
MPCHLYGPAHKNPIEFVLWLKEKCPDKYEYAMDYYKGIKL